MIEVEIRSTKGKEGFRLDCCIETAGKKDERK
jgi:hypothetical protein